MGAESADTDPAQRAGSFLSSARDQIPAVHGLVPPARPFGKISQPIYLFCLH